MHCNSRQLRITQILPIICKIETSKRDTSIHLVNLPCGKQSHKHKRNIGKENRPGSHLKPTCYDDDLDGGTGVFDRGVEPSGPPLDRQTRKSLKMDSTVSTVSADDVDVITLVESADADDVALIVGPFDGGPVVLVHVVIVIAEGDLLEQPSGILDDEEDVTSLGYSCCVDPLNLPILLKTILLTKDVPRSFLLKLLRRQVYSFLERSSVHYC